MNKCLKAALEYLENGWAALAVCPPHHRRVPEYHLRTCCHPGKRPLGTWKCWQSRLPTVEEIVGQWEVSPWSSVGIVLGQVSGLVGLDVDGEEGPAILQQLSRGEMPTTLTFLTGRGLRLLYRMPAGDCSITNRSVCREDGELRILAQGTFTVMPPSRHASGQFYRWQRQEGPGDLMPADAPGWVVGARGWTEREDRLTVRDGQAIPEGQRNNRLFRIGCSMRRQGCTLEEILVAIGCINGRCAPPLPDEEVRQIALSCSRYSSGK